MGLMDKLFGKKSEGSAAPAASASAAPAEFHYGVEDVFELKDSSDRIVVGYVFGRISKGDAIYISNPGEDVSEIVLSEAVELLVNRTSVETAENTKISIVVKNGANALLKPGTVIHSRTSTVSNVHDAYMNGLGEGYITFRRMELGDKDFARMSITDLAETFRLYLKYCRDNGNDPSNEMISRRDKIGSAIANALRSKILSSGEIYVMMSKRTGEPSMLSHTYQDENGKYVTTPPNVLLVTRAYLNVWKEHYDPAKYEFKKLESGADGKGIYNFLGNAFYIDGACGVCVLYENVALPAPGLVEVPDFSNLPEAQIPVTNPDLVRWLLMVGELTPPADQKEENLISILYSHMFRELAKAKFLVPMKLDTDPGEADSEGKVTIKKDTKMSLVTQPGKADRPALRMYTDWNRFRRYFKEEDGWNGLVQTISDAIETFDCAINVTDHREEGVYIDKDTYDRQLASK